MGGVISKAEHLSEVVGGIVRVVGLNPRAVRQDPPTIRASNHALILVLAPERRDTVLRLEEVRVLIDKSDIALVSKTKATTRASIPIHEVEVGLEIVRATHVVGVFQERRVCVVEGELCPDVRVAPREVDLLFEILLVLGFLVCYQAKHLRHLVVHVYYPKHLQQH